MTVKSSVPKPRQSIAPGRRSKALQVEVSHALILQQAHQTGFLRQADQSSLEMNGKIAHDLSEMTASRGNEGSEATGNGQIKLLTTSDEGIAGETVTREALAAWCAESSDAAD